MQHSQSRSQKHIHEMLDNPKTSSYSMPTASDQTQTSNGILVQESVLALKDGRKEADAQSSVHAQYVLQLLQLQRQAGFLCDITIHVKDRSFKAHKPLLAACSLYFRALFADVTTRESTALSLTSLTPAGFEVLLDYIYSGSLAITAENSSEVLSAATCLQMTNVVETCLSFMRSSFRMSKHKEGSFKHVQDDVNSRRSVRTLSTEDLREKNMQQNSSISNNNTSLSTVLMRSTAKSSLKQGNLQILSTRSIDETEYKNIINESSEHCVVSSTSVTTNAPLHLTIPLRSFAEETSTSSHHHPTSTALNPALRQQPSLSSNSDVVSCSRIKASTANFIAHRSSEDQSVQSKSRNLSRSPGPVLSVKTSTAILPDQARLHLPLSSFNPSVSSVKDFSATSSAVASTSPPELYSGNVQTAHIPDQNLSKDDVMHKSIGVATQYSSDDQANSVEISSDDDESGCNAWGVDRSVPSESRDLSGTPYSARTATNPLRDDNVKTAPITKTQSLPSLADSPLHPPPIERAHSLESDSTSDRIITYERAARAISALAKTESISTFPSQQDELDEASSNVRSEHTSNDEENPSELIIPSRVLRKTLLPTKLERSSSTSRSIPHFTDKLPIVIDDDSGEEIKLEPGEELQPGAFPVAKNSPQKTFESRIDPVPDDDVVLDLSVPKRYQSRSSSTQPVDLPSPHVDSVKSSSRHSSEISTVSDPNMALAVDALSLLKHAKASESNWSAVPVLQGLSMTNVSRTFETGDNFLEEANQWNQQVSAPSCGSLGSGDTSPKQTVYSRKPRRTAGGQTCTWPGCGRLFRHRNIYEEHQRLHELGIPVSQLRKCYMGARVKKTVREQLEELRTNDNVFEGGNEGDAINQARLRKRKSTSDSQEPIRKRVHAKERVPLFQMLNQSSAAAVSTSKPMQLNTPPRVRHSLSQPLPGSHNQQSTFLRAPLPPPLLPNAGLVKVVGHNGVVRWAYRPETESSQKTTIVSSGDSNMSHTVGQQQQQTSLIRVPISSSQSNTTDVNLGVNPVQQTLALLGIRTPLRRTEAATYALPAPNVSSDQMRRRLAIRETSATSLRINHAAPNPTVLSSAASAGPNFDPEAVRARLVLPREGYEIVSRDSVGSQAGLVQFHHTKPYSGPSTNPG